MQLREYFAFAEETSPFQREEPERYFSSPTSYLALLALTLSFFMSKPVLGGDLQIGVNWQNVEFTTYVRGSDREIAACKVQKIFVDHRKLGFFRVRLLPVLVVQGVELEFADGASDNRWTRGFQPDWLPDVKHGDVEWRDVSVTFKKKNGSRLHAGEAFPQTGGGGTICRFKDVTLEAGGRTWRLLRVELRNESGRPLAVWQTDHGEQRLDLISGKIAETKK
jgi:hypothetical protein